jgi:hypothetical protein
MRGNLKMPKKHTYEHVKQYIESITGYKLLSSEYINAFSKLQLHCPKNHKFEMKFNNFQQGQRCSFCNGGKRLSYEQVKSYIESFDGYELLDESYKNNNLKLQIKCPEEHIFKMSYDCFKRGQRCPICQKIESVKKRRLSFNDVKKYIEDNDYVLLDEKYINNQSKLKILCPKKHVFKMIFNNFKKGQRCPICQKKISSDKQRHSYEYIKSFIESKNNHLLSENYYNSHRKLSIKCPKNHIFNMSFNCFKRRQRCPICVYEKQRSSAEIEILEYIKNIYNGIIIPNDRTQIINPLTGYNLELDIWLPEISKAIEYNGTYWHNEKYQKIKDKLKIEKCKQKGIQLLIIDEKEWMKNKDWNKIDKHLQFQKRMI